MLARSSPSHEYNYFFFGDASPPQDATDVHEQYEYYMQNKAAVFPVPDDYMDSHALTCPARETSLHTENARIDDVGDFLIFLWVMGGLARE